MANGSNLTCSYNYSLNLILQAEERSEQLPYIAFCFTLAAIGVVANLHVIIALWIFLEDKHLTFTIYLKTISVSDLFACIGMIAKLFGEHYRCPQVYDRKNICNVTNFVGYFSSMYSMWLVVAISYDRYRHICKPLHIQYSGKKTWLICGISAILALILAFPVLFIYGNRSVQIDGNINVMECGISDEVRYTMFPFIFYIICDVVFFFLPFSVTIMYRKIRQTVIVGVENRARLEIAGRLATQRLQTTSRSLNNDANKEQTSKFDFQTVQEKTAKLTRIPVLITIFFSISYAAILAIETSKTLSDKTISRSAFMIYRYGFFVVFLNNIVNPFIYVFNHSKLRNAIKKIYTNKCER